MGNNIFKTFCEKKNKIKIESSLKKSNSTGTRRRSNQTSQYVQDKNNSESSIRSNKSQKQKSQQRNHQLSQQQRKIKRRINGTLMGTPIQTNKQKNQFQRQQQQNSNQQKKKKSQRVDDEITKLSSRAIDHILRGNDQSFSSSDNSVEIGDDYNSVNSSISIHENSSDESSVYDSDDFKELYGL